MENPIASAFKSFWHAMTSNDRHATHDSPYRTGQHVPISQSRHAPLTSIATSAVESQQDLSSPYHDDVKRPSISSIPSGRDSISRPYSPGMRSASSTKVPSVEEMAAPGDVQMQSFADGAPPPPPPSHSWMKIDKWTEAQYTELFDQLGEGCTQNDINELEHELDLTLPQDVRESLSIHDGQERGGRPTGIIFGCMLLDCEEIVQEWKNWKTVNEEYLNNQRRPQQAAYPQKGSVGASSSSSSAASNSHANNSASNRYWRQELLDRQDSQPPNAVQKAYAHPGWISLARDWGGNNIAIDLAPGPAGKWGQVILFGRDYDTKYVVARSWSHFLAIVADDMISGKAFVEEDTNELKLKEFKTETVEPAYMDILRWRADQKYGRKQAKRQSRNPPGLNTNINGINGKGSPYGSPVLDDRGRSPQRFPRGPSGSPRHGMSSPLARVQEEIVPPQPSKPGGDVIRDFAIAEEEYDSQLTGSGLVQAPDSNIVRGKDKLVDVPTPVSTKDERRDFPPSRLSRVSTTQRDENKENEVETMTSSVTRTGLGVDGIDTEMKNVTI